MQYTQLVIPGLESQDVVPDPEVVTRQIINRNRVTLLEALYERADRGNPSTDRHHTYTGLAEQLHLSIGRAVVDGVLQLPEFTPEMLLGDPVEAAQVACRAGSDA